LAYASTRDPELIRRLADEAERERVLLNVIDVPGACTFIAPAVVRRGELQIAIGTGGASPGLAARLRAELEAQVGPEYAPFVAGTVAALVGIAVRQDLPRTLLPRLLWAGFVAHGLSIAVRSWTAGHLAVATFDEALSFLALLLMAVFLVVQLRRPLVALGAVVSPLAFGLALAADAVHHGARPLPPVLDSAWLPVHVVLAVLGDAVFALAFSASLLYLVQERRLKARRAPAALRYLPSLEALDRVNYRCLVWGLILLTLGMVSGIVW